MIYVYDTIIEPDQTKLSLYGTTYTLTQRTRMGEYHYYTFVSGRQKVLVIPAFAEMFLEVKEFYNKIKKYKKYETCLQKIKASIDKKPEIEMYASSSHDGVDELMPVITCRYKDIEVRFSFENETLKLENDFMIVNGNIFAPKVSVYMKEE